MNFLKQCLTTAILLLWLPTIAQTSGDSPKRYRIGDTIPDLILNNMLNYGKTTAKFSDFKGKSIIIDFWNSGCSSCIAALPKMQHLQDEFSKDLQVLVVSKQPIEDFKFVFKNSINVKSSRLPMVFENKALYIDMFPHIADPYHVWLDKNHVVRALALHSYATSENIKDLIAGKPLNIISQEHYVDIPPSDSPRLLVANGKLSKYVLFFNRIHPSSTTNKIDTVRFGASLIDLDDPSYSMLMKAPLHLGKRIAGLGGAMGHPTSGKDIGFSDRGSLSYLYSLAYNIPPDTKVIFEKGGDQYYIPAKNASPIESELFLRNGYFIYEIAYPNFSSIYDEKSRGILKKDLERYFGFGGDLEVRRLKCLVLFRTNLADKLSTKGGLVVEGNDTQSEKGFIINNSIFGYFTSLFSRLYQQKDGPVFIDESGVDGFHRKVDMVIHSSFDDIPALNKELAKYGLGMKEEYRMLPALILNPISY